MINGTSGGEGMNYLINIAENRPWIDRVGDEGVGDPLKTRHNGHRTPGGGAEVPIRIIGRGRIVARGVGG